MSEFKSRVGAYDALVGSNGEDIPVLIVEDAPTQMVVEVLETGQRVTLDKHVQ